jgi:hypothetical protein
MARSGSSLGEDMTSRATRALALNRNGLLRMDGLSPGSEIGRCGSEIADSLRQIFETFPFSGHRGRLRFR